jgi:cysteinyl-tRNA synthetase
MIKDVFLFNTASRKKEKFVPLEPGKVSLYTCGPTVYHYAHIGNLRTYVFEDLLVRTLLRAGYEVNHVMNITDVGHLVSDGDHGEDKMEVGSKRTGKSAWEIADYYTGVFFEDLRKLHCRTPQIIPKATDHIQEMIDLIKALEKKGFIYKTADGIYFDTAKFPSYPDFAKLDVKNLEAGKRVAVGDKHLPTDFALWKFSPPGEKRQMEWESPWGKGFPGWHIECSAMAMKYLGETFDIHCGGIDHVPVHHTNEIAQSEAATGKPYVRYWMHGEFLNDDTGKMSKSKGETLTLAFLEKQGFSAMDYRFLLLQAHYRSKFSFSWESLKSAQAGLAGVRARMQEWGGVDVKDVAVSVRMKELNAAFEKAIFDDLNLPEAMAVFFAALKDAGLSIEERKKVVLKFDEVLALGLREMGAEVGLPADIQKLVAARDAARQGKNWAESDRLRGELQALGWQVKDSPQGTKVSR